MDQVNGSGSSTPAFMAANGYQNLIESFMQFAGDISSAPIFAGGGLGKLSKTDCIMDLPQSAQDVMMVKQLRINSNGEITGVVMVEGDE